MLETSCEHVDLDEKMCVACIERLLVGLDTVAKRLRDRAAAYGELEARVARAETALTGSGWTYKEGAEAWKPPLGRPSTSSFALESRNGRLMALLLGCDKAVGCARSAARKIWVDRSRGEDTTYKSEVDDLVGMRDALDGLSGLLFEVLRDRD